ncbi:hypothetical protein CYLTODRAFT_369868 [Cylindrobasidium torrendii FP15055 ss-10]|uniref:Mtf2-like C-terminal domain-containing protein n=1 Tax=Cylindrobasidium torrendii FP15055 ss-10 TaxID=1314674 RepID=A0A0D7BLN3_9AGAR|nr:hypothetical protein CYLTODRAFT_369868 [Cylindrobasidium torrendii FP15055 ss-10]
MLPSRFGLLNVGKRLNAPRKTTVSLLPRRCLATLPFESVEGHRLTGLSPDPQVTTRRRRQNMSTQEKSAFNDMFNMIFEASSQGYDGTTADVELRNDEVGKFFGRLRQGAKKLRWTTEDEHLLDCKKEEMDMCATDEELLQWAIKSVFGESLRMEAESREALAQIEAGKTDSQTLPRLQSSTYPHVLGLLMKTFRERYNDPHAALALFEHARTLSTASYVFGCSTPAYNELIETRWSAFRDLRGVVQALQEMNTNGVAQDARTLQLADAIRRTAGEKHVWSEEDSLKGGEIWDLLERIESLTSPKAARRKTRRHRDIRGTKSSEERSQWSEWKGENMEDIESDEFGFDKWDMEPRRRY